jgi:hypothetical protein
MGGGWMNTLFSNTLSHNSCNKGCNVTTTDSPKTIMELKDSASIDNIYNGAVASDMSLCSDVGLSILKDLDGNAVDAAVATALCLGVVNPYVFFIFFWNQFNMFWIHEYFSNTTCGFLIRNYTF